MASPSTSTETLAGEQPSRFTRLKNTLADVPDRVDLRGRIVRHPLPAIGIAFGLGVIAGIVRTVIEPERGPRLRIGRAILVTAGAAALRLAREAVVWQVGDKAKDWLDRNRGGASRTEAQSSRMAEVEPFLEHSH
jgi:hypothetical protein